MNEVFVSVLHQSWQGSIIALVVMVIRALLKKKAPKWTLCLLWTLVGLRLLIPFSFESKASVMTETVSGNAVITAWQDSYVGQIRVIEADTPEYSEAISSGMVPVEAPEGSVIISEKESYTAPTTVERSVTPKLSYVWLLGIAVMLGYMAFSYGRLDAVIEETEPVQKGVFRSAQVKSPFVAGLIKPRIYIPAALQDPEMAMVLLHEKCHIARFDFVVKPIAFVLLAMHWFNPILWVAYILLCKDMEGACDERVLRNLQPKERADYSRALVACAVKQRKVTACPLAFGENDVTSRIKHILSYKKPGVWVSAVMLCAAAVVGVCFMTKPVTAAPELQAPPETTAPTATTEPAETTAPVETTAPAETKPAHKPEDPDVSKHIFICYSSDVDYTRMYQDVYPKLDFNSFLSGCVNGYLYSIDPHNGDVQLLYGKQLAGSYYESIWEDTRTDTLWFLTMDGKLIRYDMETRESAVYYEAKHGNLSWLGANLDREGNTVGVHFLDDHMLVSYDIASDTVTELLEMQELGITRILSDSQVIAIGVENSSEHNCYFYDLKTGEYSIIPGKIYDVLLSGDLTTNDYVLTGPVRICNGFLLDGNGDFYLPVSNYVLDQFSHAGLKVLFPQGGLGDTIPTRLSFMGNTFNIRRVLDGYHMFVWTDDKVIAEKYHFAMDPCSRNITVYGWNEDGTMEIGLWQAEVAIDQYDVTMALDWIHDVPERAELMDAWFSPSGEKSIAACVTAMYYHDENGTVNLNELIGMPDSIHVAYFLDETHIVIGIRSNSGDSAYVFDTESRMLTQKIPAREGILYFQNRYAVIGGNESLTYVDLVTGEQVTLPLAWSQLYAYSGTQLLLITEDNLIYRVDCGNGFATLVCAVK